MKAKLFLLAAILGFASCKPAVTGNLPIVNKALGDTTSVFYADFASYPKDLHSLPIGVFDSGTGGLTVLEKILERPEFANEDFIYLADQANMPYGRYDACGKSDFLRELVIKDALFLLKERKVKIIVIACNTATAYGLSSVRSLLEQSGTGVKVIGVINAGVKATLDQLESITDSCAIGVLATPGAIASGAYQRTIAEESRKRGCEGKYEVVAQKGYGFAEAVDSEPDFVDVRLTEPRDAYRGPALGNKEEDIKPELLSVYNFDPAGTLVSLNADGSLEKLQLNSADNYARFNLLSLIEQHRKSGSKKPLKAIILGCTHYPFTLGEMQEQVAELRAFSREGEYPYRDILDSALVFINPATYTAIECYSELQKDHNLSDNTNAGYVKAYISVPAPGLDSTKLNPDGSLSYDFKYGRMEGTEEITTVAVPFSDSNIDMTNRERIKRILPLSYNKIWPERAAL